MSGWTKMPEQSRKVLYGKLGPQHSKGSSAGKIKKTVGPGEYPLDKGFAQIHDQPPKWSIRRPGSAKSLRPGDDGPPLGKYKATEAFLATRPREKFGKFLPKRPASAPPGRTAIGPGKYQPKHPDRNMAAPDFKIRRTESRLKKDSKYDDEPGPGSYNASFVLAEARTSKWAMSGWTKMPEQSRKVPPPGAYPTVDLGKISRGGKWSQVHGVGRSPLMGTF
jgi:hypothetical protein